jgi:hypothetical protein
LKNEAAPFAQRHDFFHQRGLFLLTHRNAKVTIGAGQTQLQSLPKPAAEKSRWIKMNGGAKIASNPALLCDYCSLKTILKSPNS